jgi:hypothetical protein
LQNFILHKTLSYLIFSPIITTLKKIRKSDHSPFRSGRILLVAAYSLLIPVIVFCIFYLLSGYQHLVDWYLGLNSCIYKSQNWSTDFFTPGIKSDGNMYCVIALIVASAGLVYIPRRIRKWNKEIKQPVHILPATADIAPLILCLLIAVAAWLWGNNMALPAYDEVFSAHYVAGIHPFQAISYYMLPNNHLFFNLINNLFFYPFANKVATGRLISLIAYCGLILSLFLCFKHLLRNRWLALLASIPITLQFPVWGFSFQARGYELYLLAGWGMIISLFAYLHSPHKRWLLINMGCIAIGYFCLPSFLYLHVAQLVFMALYWLFYKQKEAIFWKCQATAMLLTYLLYLPLLCFSGLDAVVHNNYVLPMGGVKTINDFMERILPFLETYSIHLFSDVHWNNISFNWLLFLLPLSLLFAKKNKAMRLFGLFYTTMWVVFLLIIAIMKKLPFERNLIGHYSVTLAGVILFAYWAIGLAGGKEKLLFVKRWVFSFIMVCLAAHFLYTNPTMLKDGLFEYEVNPPYINLADKLKAIPQGSTVAFSDESFYCYFICRQQGYSVHKCPEGNEDYYIKQSFEQLPQSMENKYTQAFTIVQYQIYKRQ